MLKIIWHSFVILFVGYAIVATALSFTGEEKVYPQRPVKVVVPFNPGGGTDTFVRIVNKAIEDEGLMPQPMVVVNKPGGAGTLGSSFVRNARPDGYTLLCLHEAIMIAKATGQSLYGPEAFEPVAATGEEGIMLLIAKDSKYQTLEAFMTALKEQPNTVKLAVNLNTPTHFTGIMLEEAAGGGKCRFVSSGGGAKRLSALLGGHVDASVFAVSEYIRFKEKGLKALAYLGKERHPTVGDVPTAIEQGYQAVNSNLQYWWFPKGTDPEVVAYMEEVLTKAMQTDYVLGKMDELKVVPRVIIGEDLDQRIAARSRDFEKMTVEQTVNAPNMVLITAVMVIIFGVLSFMKVKGGASSTAPQLEDDEGFKPRIDLAIGASVMTLVYVVGLSWGFLGFIPLTMVYVFALSMYLTGFNKKKIIYAVEIALIMSFGLSFVFTELFLVDLP